MVPTIDGISNDACFDIILMKQSYNQLCFIAKTFACMDVLKKYDKISNFEFYCVLEKATGKQNLQELISYW